MKYNLAQLEDDAREITALADAQRARELAESAYWLTHGTAA